MKRKTTNKIVISKKKILCLIDVPNWAMHNRVINLKKYLKEYSFTVDFSKKARKHNFDDYDVVYLLNWVLHSHIKDMIKQNRKYKLVTSICSHGKNVNSNESSKILNIYDAISASNFLLYNDIKNNYNETIFTPFGVDNSFFRPRNRPSTKSHIFGFVGKTNRKLKRFKEVDSLFKSLPRKYQLKVVSHKSNYSRAQMVNFYNSIGTLICFSTSEGTPNPVLEAASCGRGVISTSVGNVPSLFKNKFSTAVVKDKDELRRAVIKIYNNRIYLNNLGKYLEQRVEDTWSWEKQSRNFKKLFR